MKNGDFVAFLYAWWSISMAWLVDSMSGSVRNGTRSRSTGHRRLFVNCPVIGSIQIGELRYGSVFGWNVGSDHDAG